MGDPNEVIQQLQRELQTFISGRGATIDAMQRQIDDLTVRLQTRSATIGNSGGFDLAREVSEHPSFKGFAETGHGRLSLSVKAATLTEATAGVYSSGTIMPERLREIVPVATRTFRMRQLLQPVPTNMGYVDFVKTTSFSKASPVSENSTKPQGQADFTSVSVKLEVISQWIAVSKQILQDLPGLQASLNTQLLASLLNEEDAQILMGSGTTPDLNGLVNQATNFDTSVLSASDGWERSDILARAIAQAEIANYQVDGIVLHPTDFWSVVLTKDTAGRYISGDPLSMAETRLWGRPVAVTSALTQGQFLVGNFREGASLRVREDMVIDISDSHASFFTSNLLAIRAELREALICFTPGAFITGSFTTSPA